MDYTIDLQPTKEKIQEFMKYLLATEIYSTGLEMSIWQHTPIGDNIPVTTCTHSARLLAHKFGGKVYGYLFPTPAKKELIGQVCDGHDFAVIGKYIVDYWSEFVYCTGVPAILDMTDPADIIKIQAYYLPLTDWQTVPL
jgi:hypothetical protein